MSNFLHLKKIVELGQMIRVSADFLTDNRGLTHAQRNGVDMLIRYLAELQLNEVAFMREKDSQTEPPFDDAHLPF